MYKVKLVKVKSSNKNLRTDEIEGTTRFFPEIAKSFEMFAEGINFGVRIITTSLVKDVTYEKNGDYFDFKTLNSEYKLYVIEEIDDEEILPISN